MDRNRKWSTGLPRRLFSTGMLLLLILILMVSPTVHADSGDDPPWGYQKVTASDGTENDRFGNSVALDGDTALVGTYRDNNYAGSVYVFTRSGGVWSQQQKLTASDGEASDYFGFRVAVDGDTALVSAYRENNYRGAVYVFTRGGDGVWSEQAKLTASDGAADDYFGRSIALDGDTALVGAYGDDDRGSNSGSAYIFIRSGGVWSQQDKLIAMDGVVNDFFGASAALEGNTALIGADRDNTSRGSVYVFTRAGSNWGQQQKMTASDAAAFDYFGGSLALDGDTLLVGAYGDDDYLGSAYIFTRSSGVWSEDQKLTATDRAGFEYYGETLSLQGDTALVGAHGDNDSMGEVHMYTRDNGTWQLQDTLTAQDGEMLDEFGVSMAVGGETVLVGASGDDDQASSGGAAYFMHSSTAAAAADSANVSVGNGPVTVDVLANDSPTTGYAWDEDTFSFTQPAHGTASQGSIIYTPDSGYIGADSLTYNVCDTFHVCVDGTVTFNVREPAQLPETGFAPGFVTMLPAQPQERSYASTPITLVIPKQGLTSQIVGVPFSEGEWNLAWLGSQVGYLNGTAFPTRAGNTALTGHVTDANGQPGPFANLSTLRYGDRVELHAWEQVYTYEVRESAITLPTNLKPVMQHEEYDWLTLVTCKGFDEEGAYYRWRQIVRAVLVDVRPE